MPTPHQVLKQYWGYDEFRPLQLEIVQSALAGADTLALLPTGGGKSVCFQVPALCMEGVCLVVSPLIALMKDQVHNLKIRNIPAEAVYSGMSKKEIDRIFDNCVYGGTKFLYLSPERLHTDVFLARFERMNVSLIAVDEAHCISQWGYDFRPAYLKIKALREQRPDIPLLALTATATTVVVEDIQTKLGFRKSNKNVFQKSFARDNLAYVVLHEENKSAKMLDMLQKVQGSGVVYVQNRKATQETAEFLKQNGISADYYHAGLPADTRAKVQDAWIQNRTRIIVSTNAFGMGIDKPDVRIVVHLTLPECLEAYFQEAGRAGRDGERAWAVLLFNYLDRQRLESSYQMAFPDLSLVRDIYQALGSYCQLAIGAYSEQSFDFDVLEFSKKYDFEPIQVLNSTKLLAQEGYIYASEQVYQPATLQIIAKREVLYDYELRNPNQYKLLRVILRSYQGIHAQAASINEPKLAKDLGLTVPDLEKFLLQLQKSEIIQYTPLKDTPQIGFLTERLPSQNLQINRERYDFLRTRYKSRIDACLDYAERLQCRSQALLKYFDEPNPPRCGKCDACTGVHNAQLTNEQLEVFKQQIAPILQQRPQQMADLCKHFPTNQHARLVKAIGFLIDNRFIGYDKGKNLQWLG